MEFSSKRVADVVERVTEMLGMLLSGEDAPKQAKNLVERVGSVVANLAQALGALLQGGDDAPYPFSDSMTQPLLALYRLPEWTSELLERAGAAAANVVAQSSGGSVGAGGAPHQTHKSSFPAPVAPPPVAPLPVAPQLPIPVAPGGYSPSSLLLGSGSGADAFQLPFAVLVLLSVALLKGGRLSWLRRESHGPPAALALAIERPG